MGTAGGIIRNCHACCAVSRRRGLKSHADRAVGAWRDACPACIGLRKIAAVRAADGDAANVQGGRTAISQGNVLSDAARGDQLACKVEARRGKGHGRSDARAGKGHALRAARKLMRDGDNTGAHAGGCGFESGVDSAIRTHRQRCRTHGTRVGVREITASGDADGCRCGAIICDRNRLRRARGTHQLVPKGQALGRHADRWRSLIQQNADEVLAGISSGHVGPAIAVEVSDKHGIGLSAGEIVLRTCKRSVAISQKQLQPEIVVRDAQTWDLYVRVVSSHEQVQFAVQIEITGRQRNWNWVAAADPGDHLHIIQHDWRVKSAVTVA